AYAVHVALLTIFAGGFLTWRMSYTGAMVLAPGHTENSIEVFDFALNTKTNEFQPIANKQQLPFNIYCSDIQQTLINKDGTLDAQNTFDWFTRVKISDGTHQADGDIHMNHPYDFRGYRFFQQSYQNTANARSVTIEIQHPNAPAEVVTILKNQTAKLADGTLVKFANFAGDLNTKSNEPPTDYNNPAALLNVTSPGGQSKDVVAFAKPDPQGVSAETKAASKIGDAPVLIKDFEKVGGSHTIQIQYDPGARIVYL